MCQWESHEVLLQPLNMKSFPSLLHHVEDSDLLCLVVLCCRGIKQCTTPPLTIHSACVCVFVWRMCVRDCLTVTLCPSLRLSSTHYGPVCAAWVELCVADKSQSSLCVCVCVCVSFSQSDSPLDALSLTHCHYTFFMNNPTCDTDRFTTDTHLHEAVRCKALLTSEQILH